MSSLDYGQTNITLTFASCDTRACTSVTIFDDDIAENAENFFVSLLRTDQLDSRITLSPNLAEVEILDNDGNYKLLMTGTPNKPTNQIQKF